MATMNWCRGAVRPCRPPSQCTLPPKAASSTAATAGAAAPEGERGEAAREAEGGCTRISARSWTIKPGYVNFFKINALSMDLTDATRFSCHSDSSRSGVHGGGRLGRERRAEQRHAQQRISIGRTDGLRTRDRQEGGGSGCQELPGAQEKQEGGTGNKAQMEALLGLS